MKTVERGLGLLESSPTVPNTAKDKKTFHLYLSSAWSACRPSPDKPVPPGNVADHTQQQLTLQHGREPGVQCERGLLGAVQDLQAVQTHGSSAHAAAGLAALPGGGLAALPDAAAAGRLPPGHGLLSGHGLGQQPPPLPLQVQFPV